MNDLHNTVIRNWNINLLVVTIVGTNESNTGGEESEGTKASDLREHLVE